MNGLFEALEARFNANPALRRVGRRLYEGFDEKRVNVVKPYTEVNATEDAAKLSTWDHDISEWDLRFRYHAKDLKTTAADDWVDAMTEAFKDANILAGTFTTAGCRMITAAVPRFGDGAYDATAQFSLIIQRKQNSPLVRGL